MPNSAASPRIEIVPLPPLVVLEAAWRELEARSELTVFLSWAWIGTWLKLLPPTVEPRLVRATADGRDVGLAVVCDHRVTRRLVRARGCFMNCTGDPDLDEITIEFNGFLAERGFEVAVARQGIEQIATQGGWDEIDVSACLGTNPLNLYVPEGLRRETRRQRAAHHVDLEVLRAAGGDFVDGLERGMRQKLKRSIRDFESVGPLRLEAAASLEEALAFLEDLKVLHVKAWLSRGKTGSFANLFLNRFHDALIRSHFDQGLVQMLRLSAGDRRVGFLYNLVHRGVVYQYQSGFDLDASRGSGWRPGLVSHVRAIELNRDAGLARYDFLAGDQRYKQEGTRQCRRLDGLDHPAASEDQVRGRALRTQPCPGVACATVDRSGPGRRFRNQLASARHTLPTCVSPAYSPELPMP